MIAASENDRTSDLVAATLSVFEKYEETEGLSVVDRLVHALRTGGAAVKGISDSVKSLRSHRARVLALSQAYAPAPGVCCIECGEFTPERVHACPNCGRFEFREVAAKEELVRRAERTSCSIEIVKDEEAMRAFGGIGCLLRYLRPDSEPPAA